MISVGESRWNNSTVVDIAKRLRYEAEKLNIPITETGSGIEIGVFIGIVMESFNPPAIYTYVLPMLDPSEILFKVRSVDARNRADDENALKGYDVMDLYEQMCQEIHNTLPVWSDIIAKADCHDTDNIYATTRLYHDKLEDLIVELPEIHRVYTKYQQQFKRRMDVHAFKVKINE